MPAIELTGTKIPRLNIKVGHFQGATYRIRLKLPGKPRIQISTSNEADLAQHGVKSITQLDGAELDWDVRVYKATTSPEELYQVRVRIEQEDDLIHNGLLQYPPDGPGRFGDALVKPIRDSVTFWIGA